jgi:putative transcriptional regulator
MGHFASLAGKLLIAMPGIRGSIFEESVVLLCAHSDQGAMGLVLNKPAPLMCLKDLIDQIDWGDADNLNQDSLGLRIMQGGPVESFRGFVLHDSNYPDSEFTLNIGANYRLTTTIEILRDIATGKGPERRIIAVGYAGWAPGQLENEIQHNGWLLCDAREDIIFGENTDTKHTQAMRTIGVNPAMLSNQVGHA